MDPASIITYIDTALGACGNVVSLVQAIMDIRELPEAFQQLENKLDLVQSILGGTRHLIEIRAPEADCEVAMSAVKSCQEQVDHLKNILQEVKQNSFDSKGGNLKLWGPIKKFYRNAVVRLGKGSKGRVEDLMRDVLESLRLLSTWCGMEDQLNQAVDDISSIEASLEDQECETTGNNTLNIGGNVHGNTSAQSFGDNYVDSHAPGSLHVAGSHGTVHFGNKTENHNHHHESATDKAERIKQWLRGLATYLTFDDVQDKMIQSASKTRGAGKWFTRSSDFKSWREGRVRKLFVHGKLGTGKTVLMSLVIDKMISKPRFFCMFAFLGSDIGEAQSLTNLLSTLLIQLLERSKCRDICDAIHDKFDELHRSCRKPTPQAYLAMLKSQMEFLACGNGQIFLIVDALDQCDDKTLPDFLKACEEFPSNVRMLFTSTYNNSDFIKADKSMEIAAHDDDIKAYFEEAFDTNPYLQRAVKNSEPSLRDQVLRTVVQKSQRNFLLATMHLERLISHTKPYRYHSLENCLIGLSETPDEFYKKALERIKQMERRVGIIMSWLAFAQRPITIEELAHAMKIQSEIEDIKGRLRPLPMGSVLPSLEHILKEVCAGIVEVDGKERVQFQHVSAKLYLMNSEPEILRGAQTMITDVCLVCLHHIPPEESSQSELSSDSSSEQSGGPSLEVLDKRCQQYPLLRYAADHWGHHLLFKEKGKYDINKSAWGLLTDARALKNATQIMSNFEFRNERAVSGMHVAAYFGLVNLTRKAQKNDRHVDINACTNNRKESVLHWAVAYRQHEFLRFIIDNEASLISQDSKGRTALHVALEMEDLPSVEMLLSPNRLRREQYINVSQEKQGWAPLHCAVYEGKSRIVEQLLAAGAEVNKPDVDGFTPLCLAFQQGYLKTVELLVDKKASLEVTCADGTRWSLLERAAAEGRTTVMQLLIEKGVDLSAPVTDDGKTPLRLAVEYQRGMIAWLLIEAGVDVNIPDREGITPLYWAAENCQLSAMWLLLENKAIMTATPNKAGGMTPLHIAAFKGHESAVLLLLTMGTDPFQRDISLHTALYWAIVGRHKEVVQLLLLKADAGRLIHDQDGEDRTALHHAASQGYLEISEMLISYGADRNAKDVDSNTALQLAHKGPHKEVYEYLSRPCSDVNTDPCVTMTRPAVENQDAATPKLTDSSDTECSVTVEEGVDDGSDSQWSGEIGSDIGNVEIPGRFRARVEDYLEDE